MKFDQALNEGNGKYDSDQESRMIPVREEVLRAAREIVKTALGTTTYGENEDLMRKYHHTYLDLDQALRDAGVNPGSENWRDEDFDDVNASDLSKALSLGKQLKSPEVAQATQELHGKVAQKIKDVTSKLA